MKHLYLTVTAVCFAAIAATAQITAPRVASPAATVQQTIGISTVTIHYSRPAVRERAIWGEQVPYGWNVQGFGAGNKAPWRAGANENTTITLSHDAVIAGNAVAAGTYGLFYVINEDNTGEIILSGDHRAWGSFWYDPANDVMRAKIQLQEVAHTERLTFDFVDIDRTSATLVLDWEKKRFPVKVSFDVDQIVYNNARQELTGTTGFSWQGYHSAAQYLLQTEKELDQALAWSIVASNQHPAFNTLNVKAGILEKLGREEEAADAREKAMEQANEAELNIHGYQLLNAGMHDKAIEIFTLNTKRYPKSANVWDSLGEAYAMAGKEKEAIRHFEKALSMDPPENVRANSEKYLARLKK